MKKIPSIHRLALALFVAVAAIGATAGSAFALNCTETIKQIQTENDGKLLVRFNNNTWHVIADANHPARADRLSMLMAAKLSGKRMYMSWSSGSCSSTDYGSIPYRVRLVD